MCLRLLYKLFSCCYKGKSTEALVVSTTNVAKLILQLSNKKLIFEIGKCSSNKFDDSLCIESLETIEREEVIQLHDEENNDIDYIATVINTIKLTNEEQLLLKIFINQLIKKHTEGSTIGICKSTIASRNKSRITYIYIPTTQKYKLFM